MWEGSCPNFWGSFRRENACWCPVLVARGISVAHSAKMKRTLTSSGLKVVALVAPVWGHYCQYVSLSILLGSQTRRLKPKQVLFTHKARPTYVSSCLSSKSVSSLRKGLSAFVCLHSAECTGLSFIHYLVNRANSTMLLSVCISKFWHCLFPNYYWLMLIKMRYIAVFVCVPTLVLACFHWHRTVRMEFQKIKAWTLQDFWPLNWMLDRTEFVSFIFCQSSQWLLLLLANFLLAQANWLLSACISLLTNERQGSDLPSLMSIHWLCWIYSPWHKWEQN